MKLNLGAGPIPVAGFLSVDANLAAQPDIAALIEQLPVRDDSVDEIIAYHVIEHATYWEAEAALSEWYRALQPGGRIALECPNIEWVARSLVHSANFTRWSQMGMWGIYGDPNPQNPFYSHKWGYTAITLAGMLYRAGFTDVLSTHPKTHVPERNLRLEARKPAHDVHPLWKAESATQIRPRLFWFLIAGPEIASSRIHGHRIHQFLKARGWDSFILLEPWHSDWISDIPLPLASVIRMNLFREGDVAVFQKLGGMNTAALVEHLTGLGVRTVYIDSDLPVNSSEAKVALWTVCTSAYLAQQYRNQGVRRVVYLPDPAEGFAPAPPAEKKGERIRCVWFGNWSAERDHDVAIVRDILRESEFADFELRVVTSSSDADARWSMDTILGELEAADIAVLPVRTIRITEKAKSANRVTQAMAAGLPVIASDIPAYREAIENGWNGYICVDQEAWRLALRSMRDKAERQRMAQNAYAYAVEAASIEVIGPLWETFFSNIASKIDLSHNQPSTFSTRLKTRQVRAVLYIGIAARAPTRSRRLSYMAYAWANWPFSLFVIRMTVKLGLHSARSLVRRGVGRL